MSDNFLVTPMAWFLSLQPLGPCFAGKWRNYAKEPKGELKTLVMIIMIYARGSKSKGQGGDILYSMDLYIYIQYISINIDMCLVKNHVYII